MSDLLKSITSGVFTILSFVLLYYGTKAYSFLFGFILAVICLYISYRFLKSVSAETQKAAARMMEEQEKEAAYKRANHDSEIHRNLLMASTIANLTAIILSSDHKNKS